MGDVLGWKLSATANYQGYFWKRFLMRFQNPSTEKKKGFLTEAPKDDYRVATLFCEKYEVG